MNFSDKVINSIKERRLNKLAEEHMETKGKKQSKISHRFTFPLSESTLLSFELAGKDKPIDIQILKEGKFRHPWWGILTFNGAFFKKLIHNFDQDIPQEEIAFDFQHRSDAGAAAWVKKLFQEGKSLMASVLLTEEGRKSIEKKEFKYFSAEYTDDYSEYLFEEEVNENGETIEKEVKINYGPALLGGGLTNRPFIKGMKPVSLSEAGEIVTLEEILENEEEVNVEMEKKLKDLEKEQKKLQDQMAALKDEKDEKSQKELKDLQIQLEEIKTDIKTLNEVGEKKKRENAKSLTETEKKLEETSKKLEETSKELAESNKRGKELSGKVDTLGDSVKTLMKSNEDLAVREYKTGMEKKLGDFKTMGAFPSTLKIIEPILFLEETKKFSITLSEVKKEGEDPVKRTLSLADVIYDLLDSIPQEFRFSESEESEAITSASGGKEMSVTEVEKYATEKKISFGDALVELQMDGKIKED